MSSCQNKDNPIANIVAKFENIIPKEELIIFSKKSEFEAVRYLYSKYGLELRNKFLQGKYKDQKLINYFHYNDIIRLDDMSIIILRCLHRKLNEKNMDIEHLINEKKQAIKFTNECNRLKKLRLNKNLEYKPGDTIQLRMKVLNSENKAYPVECLYKSGWIFNNEKDLLIIGVVIKNGIAYKDIEENIFMKFRAISVNKNIPSPMKTIKTNDTVEVVLNYDIIEKI